MSVDPTMATPAPQTNGVVATEAPKEELLSPKYGELARHEKRIRERARQFEAEKLAKENEWKQKDEEYKSSFIHKNKLKENPLEALSELGLSQDQLVQLILNGPQQVDPTVRAMQAELAAIKEAQFKAEKAATEQQTAQYEQALAQIRSDAGKLIESDESYETIKEMGATEAVVELIKQTYDTDKKLLSVPEAAAQVEEYLLNEALKMAGLKKVKAKLTPAEIADEAIENVSAKSNNSVTITPKNLSEQLKNQQNQTPIKTLTNSGTPTSSKPLSPRERALLAFQGKLNK